MNASNLGQKLFGCSVLFMLALARIASFISIANARPREPGDLACLLPFMERLACTGIRGRVWERTGDLRIFLCCSLCGFASSLMLRIDATSARLVKDRDLPRKKVESPFLQNRTRDTNYSIKTRSSSKAKHEQCCAKMGNGTGKGDIKTALSAAFPYLACTALTGEAETESAPSSSESSPMSEREDVEAWSSFTGEVSQLR